jgi:hypothetical protein
MNQRALATLWVFAIAATASVAIAATDVGQVKVASGDVVVEREGAVRAATPGFRLRASDVLRTGADGSVGITMDDNSRLSLGPNSTLTLDRFEFDATTQAGKFDTSLRRGSLSVVSGRIAKQSPDAMTVRTPSTVLGVRGTEFAVSHHDAAPGFIR